MMEEFFKAIGLDVPNENALAALAADVIDGGEQSVIFLGGEELRYSRCLKLGNGLEVWSDYLEEETGEIVIAGCRPAFRARRSMRVSPWYMSCATEDGTVFIQGFVGPSMTEIIFQLQNRAQLNNAARNAFHMQAGLCGLATYAEISERAIPIKWQSMDEVALEIGHADNHWIVTGRILEFEYLKNPRSADNLIWFLIMTTDFEIEIVVNELDLEGEPRVGHWIDADIWLQGHVNQVMGLYRPYEGIDRTVNPADFWGKFRRIN